MKTKKTLIIILAVLILGIIVFSILIFKKNPEQKFISLEMILPSEATVTYDPIMGDIIKLNIGKSATLEATLTGVSKKDTKYVIEDGTIISINNNTIKALKEGDTKIYMIDKKENIKSNTINVKVGD